MKRITLLIISVVAVLSAHASLLWEISTPGSDKKSYIFGTHHMATEAILNKYPTIDSLLAECDALISEVSLTEMTDINAQSALAPMMMAPADSTLSRVMSAQAMLTLDSLVKHYGIAPSAAALDILKPGAIAAMLTLVTIKEAMPELGESEGIDIVMMRRGEEAGKKMLAFETLAQQADILYGAPIALQAEQLEKMLSESSDMAADAADLYLQYSAGDIDRLHTTTEAEMTPEEYQRLLVSRNEAWVSFIMGLLPTASVMIVVGAGHLGGPDGLIAGLRNQGYAVNPIQSSEL